MTGIYVDSIKDKTGTRVLASDSGSAWSWGSGVPSGTIQYITHQAMAGYGDIGDRTDWYPSEASHFNKTLQITVTAVQHAPFSKLKIDFFTSARVYEATHTLLDIRLARFQSTDAPTSDTDSVDGTSINLIRGTFGDVTSATQNYDTISGSGIDDISSLTGDIKYIIQIRNAGAELTYAGTTHLGDANSRHQMIIHGIY